MTSTKGKPVVVSLTPLPLSADSRTLKQVTSVHRFGFKSIAIEGRASDFAKEALPFEVISIRARDRSGSSAVKVAPTEAQVALTPAKSGRLASPVAVKRWSFARHLWSFTRHLRIYLYEYFFQVLSVAPRADIYYLHAFYQFPAVCILCLRYRAKMIYDAHDFYSQLEDDASLSSYWRNWVMPFERALERACVWFADDVVTVNEGIAALMRERFGCEPLILRNVHDLRLDYQPAGTIRETIGLSPDAFLIVSIGNWKPGMAMDQMFDALAGLPSHVHIAFLGSGYPSLVDAITSRSIDGRVHLVQPVLPQEVVPFIRSADASVVLYYGKSLTYQNALPNRFFQSIAAKLPLVYPDLSEIRRLAERYGVGIMADPQNPAEIKSALSVLIEDHERRAVIRRNLDLASRELNWEREEQVLRVLFDRHLSKTEALTPTVDDSAG